MSHEDAIQAEGAVIEVLPNSIVRVELPNGHHLLARVSRRTRPALPRLTPGDRVAVQMSPYDLSKGLILDRTMELKT
ncbi:MAG: translation initiation factor IF-1 [Candidatus Omnitrophica bacterium]|nr:translation initiation factor IF-1 [Candidatus Omnitrophota bacterium]